MKTIRVWDIATRLFHWSLVVAISFSIFSAFQDKMLTGYDKMHLRAGVTVLILTLFRIVWGFLGSDTARFTHFLKGPAAIRAYLADRKSGKSKPVGHNPLGGWSVGLMLALMLLQSLMGLFSTDAMFFEGPLASMAGDSAGLITSFHEITGYTLMGLIILHIVAVLYYALIKQVDMIRPMVTGKTLVADDAPEPAVRHPLLALVLFIGCGAIVCLYLFG